MSERRLHRARSYLRLLRSWRRGWGETARIYRRLLRVALPHWRVFLLGVIAMVCNGLADVGFAYLMKPLIDQGLVDPNPALALWFALAIVVIFILRGITSYLAAYSVAWIGNRVVATIRRDMFAHLIMLPKRFYDHATTGDVLTRLTSDTGQVAGAATKAVIVLVSDSIKVVFQVALMFYLSFWLSLGFFVIAPVVAVLINAVSGRLRRISKNIQESTGAVLDVAEEVIAGHDVVKVFGGQDYEKKRFFKAVERNRVQSMKLVATREVNVPLIQLIVALVMAGVVFIVVSGLLPQAITPGDFTAYMIAMSILLPSVKRLTAVNAVLQQGIASGIRIFEFIDELTEPDHGDVVLTDCRGRIRYRDVRFRYGADKDEALRGVTLDIQPGSMAALVGKSGAGKSTLVGLLPRFYEPSGGEIMIDEHPLARIRRQSLRAQIAYVGQDITLFNDSVKNNIAYGRAGDAIDTQAVIAAARRAYAWEFIERWPDGIDTVIGEDGVLLSGGQRQRLAIARALFKDAPILILDEATSALDTESEKYIQAGLETLMRGRTTVVIAHRLSTIKKADVIFVLADGALVESGGHEELLARGGAYAALHRLQFGA